MSLNRTDISLGKDWSQRKTSMPKFFVENVQKILDFEVRPDDTFLVTLPKCGTTWMQELLWLVLNNFDFQTASANSIMKRSSYVE